MKKICQSPKWKVIITGILTLAISISLAVLDNWDTNQSYFGIKVSVFFLLSICDIIFLLYCTAEDIREKALVAELKKQLIAYESALTGIIQVSQVNATDLNNCIHEYINTKSINPHAWNYKKVCYELCRIIYLFVCELSNSKECEIAYVRLDESTKDEITMYAYKNHVDQPPKLLNKKRNYSNKLIAQYFDMKMFDECINETRVLFGSETINNKFYRTPEEREGKKEKYNQYIAIPVFCDNKKMVGLLEISCFESCSLGKSEEEIKDVANRYFVPYANIFLLLHKADKALHLGI